MSRPQKPVPPPTLPAGFLDTVFPFHFAVNRRMRLTSLGPSLRRWRPNFQPGRPLGELLHLSRPLGDLTYAHLKTHQGSLVVLELADDGAVLRGQFLPVDRGTSLLFLGSPWLTDPEDFARFGLTMDDFAVADPIVDLTHVLQAQKTAISDARKLAAKLAAQRQDLRLAGSFQRAILQSANFSIIATDPEGTIQFFNAGAETMLGYSRDDIVGKCSPAMFHDAREVKERARELSELLGRPVQPGFETFVANVRADAPDEREWTYIRRDGSRIPVHLSITPLRSDDGMVTGFLGIASDITDRKRKDDDLRNLSLIAERTDNGVVLTDASGKVVWVNAGFTRLTGYTLAEVVGKTPGHVLQGPDTDPATIQYARQCLGLGMGFQIEILNYNKNGRPYWVHTEVQPILNPEGQLTNFMGIQADITQRRDYERRLAEAEERWKFALEGNDAGVWDWDIPGRRIYFTDRIKTMLGYTVQEFPNTLEAWSEKIHPDDTARVHAEVDRYLADQTQNFECEYRMRRADGSWNWILDSGKTVARDASGQPLRMVGTHTDIQQRKLDEEKLRSTLAELERFNRLMVNRELRVIELKNEVNRLLASQGAPPLYPAAIMTAPPARP